MYFTIGPIAQIEDQSILALVLFTTDLIKSTLVVCFSVF